MVTVIKIKEEDYEYIESKKLSEYEPIHSVVSRLLDKAKAFDKRVKK